MSADPFAKVKGMIQEMIEKLVEEAGKEAEDKTEDVDDLHTSIDQATSKIAKLSEDIATLQNELAQIAAAQKEATELREKEKEAWAAAKKDYEGGLEGVGMALQVLRDYYAEKEEALLQESKHEKSSGAASGIIGMLEVVESDFSKLLAEGSADEDQAQKAYDDMTQENKVTTATKETEVKYKTKDKKETENLLVELKADLGSSEEELKKRREAEIAGLKDALVILEEESGSEALLQ